VVPVISTGFMNGMTSMHSADDGFPLLIHLGYLNYDKEKNHTCVTEKIVK